MPRDAVTATVAIDPGNPLRLEASRVSRAVLDMIGVRPPLGRLLPADDEGDRPHRWPSSVIRCDSVTSIIQSDVLGRSLLVDDTPARLVGVMPAQFEFPDAQTQFWLPRWMRSPTSALLGAAWREDLACDDNREFPKCSHARH